MKRRFAAYNRNGKDASGRRIQYCCTMCTRTLDDCLFVDEETKQFTPYCKVCRKLLRENFADMSKPRMINLEKTAYVFPESCQSNKEITNHMEYSIPKGFAIWSRDLQKPIINKMYLAGVLPCVKWSTLRGNEQRDTVYQAKLVFHRLYFTHKV